MDATSTSSEEEPTMKSDTSKTSTEYFDDSSGDESSTERGYRRCIQKYSKYLPDGELGMNKILRRRRDDEHDDIISKDGEASGDTIERYKQFLGKNHKGAPDEGDYQPMEIIFKSESSEDVRLEADDDFHRRVSPDAVSTLKEKTPKQTSNVLADDDLDFVNDLLAGSDSDDENDMMVQTNEASLEDPPRVENRTDGQADYLENKVNDNDPTESSFGIDLLVPVNRTADNAQTPTEEPKAPRPTSEVPENDDTEAENMMSETDQVYYSSDDDDEVLFQASYANIMSKSPYANKVAGKSLAPKKSMPQIYDDDIDESHRILSKPPNGNKFAGKSIAPKSPMPQIYDDDIDESHRLLSKPPNGNKFAGKTFSPKSSIPRYDDEIDESHRIFSQEQMLPQMDEVDEKPGSETRRWGNTRGYLSETSVTEESLTPIDERSSPNRKQNPTTLAERGTPMNPHSDSGESSIMTSDDSTLSTSPKPITKESIPKQNNDTLSQEGLTPIEEGTTFRSQPNLDEEDTMPQVVNDPWIRMMERRDMRIDHMDTDFLCLRSKPFLQNINNVIGNNSFSEDETILSQRNHSAPMTPEGLFASDDENAFESKMLAAGNEMNIPSLNTKNRRIQGAGKTRQGSPPTMQSNAREIKPNDRTIVNKRSDPRQWPQRNNSTPVSEDKVRSVGQGIPATNEDRLSESHSQSRSIEGPQHEQTPDPETSSMGTNLSVTMRASGGSLSRVDQSAEFTHSVVSSNGWESTSGSSTRNSNQDIENPTGIDSDDEGPPHLFSDDGVSYQDERDPLTAGHNSQQRQAPRSSELTVVRSSRTRNNDSDALVRERHEIATGHSSGNRGESALKRSRIPVAEAERGLSMRKAKVFMVLFISFLLGAGTFFYIWQNYLKKDKDAQAMQDPTLIPVIQPSQPPARKTQAPSWSPSWSPSLALTKSPFEALRDLLLFSWPSLESKFANSKSPQFKALLWLQNNSNIDSYDSQQKIQRFALATFFYSTNGAGWINKGSWLTDSDECEWNFSNSFRPPCNEEGLYVYLELNSNGVSGSIPSELALLSNSLVRLELSQNGSITSVISGSLPPALGALTLLESINLANNALSGELPNEIGQWTKATAIDLSGNGFSSQLPTTIAALTSLRSLNLQRNSFTLLPRQIGDLLSLRTLDVSYNRLGNIPLEIGNMISLRTLDISHNQIQSPIPSEIGLLSLRNLDLSHNQIQSSIPSEIGRQSGLVDLDLSNNLLSGTIPFELSGATLLRNLALHNNGLVGTIPATFGALSRLATLRVEANDLTGIVSQRICNVFNESVPAFVSDCMIELDCPCCMFCCEDPGACQCQLEGEIEFLCDEYATKFGISSSGVN